jgi:hypothetical protein
MANRVEQFEVTEVTAAFDSGTSDSKILVTWQSDEYPFEMVEKYYLVPPAMRSLKELTYCNQLEFCDSNISTEKSCLLSYVDPGTAKRKFWEMGTRAVRPGQIQAEERKFEKCLAKVLTLLGYLVQGELKKTDEPIELTLGLLLPKDEFGDRKVLAEWLREVVSSFEYNGIPITNIKLVKIDIKPEGYGIYKASGEDSALILNWGHSDLTKLIFIDGDFSFKHSVTWPLAGFHGFMRILDFPFTYELEAARIISAAGRKMDTKILKELVQSGTAAEMRQLKQAITLARCDFWDERQEEFNSIQMRGQSAILLGGGTIYYFDIELNQFIEKQFKVLPDWGQSVMNEFIDRFDIEPDSFLPQLFKDIYGYFCILPGVEKFESKTVEVVNAG